MSMASLKPSSSSSVPIGGWRYDVFLSFRGEDTRNNFVDHLHTSLVQKGIRVFKDDEMLCRGKPISSELLTAIEQSRLAVVVFSKNYANSSWCLDELAKIMECQDRMAQKVLPVFYHVDPSDVRGQKRDFATAFQKHEEKASKWRKALTAAGSLSGWNISPDNGLVFLNFLLQLLMEHFSFIDRKSGGESSFIGKIVQEISSYTQPRHMENNLIGIESHIDKLNLLVSIEATDEVRMVGIYGMGGIGKTTIARALFNRISSKFEGSSFVKVSVRENGDRDICALQQIILRDITDHKCKIKDPKDGAEMIRTRFCSKKVILVLDDVDDVKQLEYLAETHEWFGVGSRIIITSRDEHLLSDTNGKYKPALLLKDQAVELFSRHAFRNHYPPNGYEELSNRAIRYTGRLPLALKVLGSFFRGREAGVWESALNRLAKTPNSEIFETLKISFDGLEVSEQKIFLDIVCFFKGQSEEHVTRLLDTFDYDPVIGISVLIEKSLLTISNKQLDMHDLVHEMGLKIVRENYPNSRLWVRDEIHDFIKENTKQEAVEAIVVPFNYQSDVSCLDESDSENDFLSFLSFLDGSHLENEGFSGDEGFGADIFENMKNLRLLKTHGKFTSYEPTFLPIALRWLCWNKYPFSSLKIANKCKLVGLEMCRGKIEHLWMGQKVMPYLKFIHLEKLYCLQSFPDVSGAPNIERLILRRCKNLVEVHKSLGYLKKLAYFDMSGCENLKCLPSMIQMQLLETLNLSGCVQLENFPEVSSRMVKLSSISLTRCVELKVIPSSIGKLKSLKSLHLDGCLRLQKLPEELGSIEKLEEVWLGLSYDSVFFSMEAQFISYHTLAKLCCLRKLDLSWRQIGEQEFPNNLDAFSFLEELDLSGNYKLVELPASMSLLSRLKHLKLIRCGGLHNIQGLPSEIQVLEAGNCRALEKIENLTQEYAWLHTIFLPGCNTLLKNQVNERYLDNMLQKSFLEKHIARDGQLNIWIPGSKIPYWFEEQHYYGCQLALKLSPKLNTTIIGFTVCVIIRMNGYGINGSANDTTLIVYVPFSVFRPQQEYLAFERDDWPFCANNGCSMDISIMSTHLDVVKCGAHIVYKEDIESIHQIKACTYRPNVSCHNFHEGNSFQRRRDIGCILNFKLMLKPEILYHSITINDGAEV